MDWSNLVQFSSLRVTEEFISIRNLSAPSQSIKNLGDSRKFDLASVLAPQRPVSFSEDLEILMGSYFKGS